jgi:predicted flap endonuclease-1-like 5' DNA nuclease
MATSIREILKSRDELIERVREQQAAVKAGARVEPGLLLREKEHAAAGLRQRLEQLEKAREATVARLDQEIDRRRTALSRLGQELAADRANLAKAKGTPAPPSLTEVKGVGPAFSERLVAVGIADAAALAAADPGRVAEVLDISPERAAKIVKAARKLR